MRTPSHRWHPRLAAILPAALIVALLALTVACGEKDSENITGPGVVRPSPAGESRQVLLGLGIHPVDATRDGAVAAFALAGQYADIALIQRAPPWADFLPGGGTSAATKDTTRLETSLLRQYRLKTFFAIDPTDPAVRRARIAAPPPSINPQAGFEDPGLRKAFVSYAAYIATNYQPAYLALGVEVNMLASASPKEFDAFVTLYDEAYDVAKEASPGTLIFPTFQLEELLGRLDDLHPPRWELVDRFAGKMDALAVSTYPFLAPGATRAAAIPADYFIQLKDHFAGPVIVAETGYPSAPIDATSVVGTPEDQQAYLARILADAEANRFAAVVWASALDPVFARSGPAAVLRDTGLRKTDGSNKLAWTDWEDWLRRPVR